MSLLYTSTCIEHYVLIITRSKVYYTASDIITPLGGRPVQRLRVLSQPVHRTAIYCRIVCLLGVLALLASKQYDMLPHHPGNATK